MEKYSGKLLVIDGIDGSGKATQLRLLKERLEKEGLETRIADFPQYNKKSAGPAEEYLSGKYGQAGEVTPYQASVLYAVDRYDASFLIRRWLEEGKIVLANRYVSANMAHQGGKIDNPLERKAFFNWLCDLEYQLFDIPCPDLTLILKTDPALAQELAKKRARADWSGSAEDIHESDLNHLQHSEKIFEEIASDYPGFQTVDCFRDGRLLEREEVSLLIWTAVRPVILGAEKKPQGFSAIGDVIGADARIRRQALEKTEPEKEKETATEIAAEPEKEPEIRMPRLLAERLSENAKIPAKAHAGDAGYDLYADDCFSVAPYGQALITTGIRMAIPDGYVGLVWDKSGVARDGLKTMGGVIDSGYRGEIKVIVKNLGEDVYNIAPGQKIAQLLIQEIGSLPLDEGEVSDRTERQEGGFGSSGKF